ncbi:DUF1284 domain-containing protein [Treponema phagedenis]|uniref:DUF1284 domain-containing protein n=1 Tax=Treponema phagedenis TaxID=162 RepID=A0AAE6IVM7_TREPH|nr:DUF1284 domain-containing protein [Treponema phagedenis]QEJ99036.1 DUF1284 domain-containing protein [Treponema phagedenis]QEK01828.1 DUF1284 domain-containing protein [Treponema phagedenis]QEK04546.1 DUF1284 domain-containing protein [Treponema phagedenis]QEK06942.1 DUF1284 domain-containing protein [Treponema phagedenis]QEK10202.1 DUF1284 domain-containing protein [Treponema phagedenis]
MGNTATIRPHHILCTRAFRGKGYSDDFLHTMRNIIERIKKERIVTIIYGGDTICSACPQYSDGKCETEAKVQNIDKNVIHFLGIEQRRYSYDEIDKIIAQKFTKPVFESICAQCEWKQQNICTYEDVIRPFV